MRYQELIYSQNENSGIRNKDILNVNMSSDICVFDSPLFTMSGSSGICASKINCTGSTTQYIISTATTIPLTFNFTANTSSFTANSATFKFEIYKYDSGVSGFTLPPVYKSDPIEYSTFSATNYTLQTILVSNLNLDGDYLIKGYYEYPICTEFLNKLGKTVDTLTYRSGKTYGLYDSELDYYFLAIKSAEKPIFLKNSSNTPAANQLFQQVLLPQGESTIIITNTYAGFFILTLNGLVLAPNLDYTYTGNIVTLSAATVTGDVLTVIYTTDGGNTIAGDNINIESPIVSGITDAQGTNTAYFNTTTGKYEIYSSVEPSNGGSIIIMINGVTLANGLDYYQSISNPNRIILEGNLIVGDIITIAYFPVTTVVNGLITNSPSITWKIDAAPQKTNGIFTLQVSTGTSFSSFYTTGTTDYVVGQTIYQDSFVASGTAGTTLYYRVKNSKNYVDLCGNIVNSTIYSDTIPIVILTNSINSY